MYLQMYLYGALSILVYQLSFVRGQQPPVISKFTNSDIQNHILLLKEGTAHQFSLTCEGRGQPEPTYKWFRDAEEITSSQNGIDIGDNNEVLTFSDPKFQHLGYYYCEASNDWGKATSEVIQVTDELPSDPNEQGYTTPKFKAAPKPKLAPYEQSTTFDCVAEGAPEPDIKWTKDGVEINPLYEVTHRGKISLDRATNSLTIQGVKEEDIGTYACNATNDYGYVYKSVPLTILKQGPKFWEPPTNKMASIGAEITFRCGVRGYPKPTIVWKHSGVEIDPTVRKVSQQNYEIGDESGLTIKHIKLEDTGDVTCTASNTEGSITGTAELKVVNTTTIEIGPPEVTKQIGEDVRMDCKVIWDPSFDLELNWKKDTHDVKVDGERIFIDKASVANQALTIKQLKYEDAGTYTCVASTATTDPVTESGELKVIGIEPTIVPTNQSFVSPEGKDVRILCQISGDPVPTQKWFKVVFNNYTRLEFEGGVAKSNGRIRLEDDGSLLITNAVLSEDDGKYICDAENDYGMTTANADVKITKKSEILSEYKEFPLNPGSSFTFDCDVKVDPELEGKKTVEWHKDDEKLDLENVEQIERGVDCSPPGEDRQYDECTIGRIHKHDNHSLTVLNSTEEDVGEYKCVVHTGVEEPISLYYSYYDPDASMWILILIAVIIAILAFVLCILCIICCRKRATKNGTYDVHPDELDASRKKKISKQNQSEIQYSIDDEIEGTLLDVTEDGKVSSSGKKKKKDKSGGPIFRPKNFKKSNKSNPYTGVPNDSNGTARQPNRAGSENSLLEEDDCLRKGMDEDGSFREGRYAH